MPEKFLVGFAPLQANAKQLLVNDPLAFDDARLPRALASVGRPLVEELARKPGLGAIVSGEGEADAKSGDEGFEPIAQMAFGSWSQLMVLYGSGSRLCSCLHLFS